MTHILDILLLFIILFSSYYLLHSNLIRPRSELSLWEILVEPYDLFLPKSNNPMSQIPISI